MKKNISQSGFTLIETLIAILILSLSVTALISLAANGFFTVRYARNQIIADTLTQEGLEFLRNYRDSSIQQGKTWNEFLTRLNVDGAGLEITYDGINKRGCFSTQGCVIDPYTVDKPVRECGNSGCPNIAFYPTQSLYGYGGVAYPFPPNTAGYETSYKRTIKAEEVAGNPDQIIITFTMQWMNGVTNKTATQSVVLTNWTP